MKIAITGASGMLGTALIDELSRNHDIYATGRNKGIERGNVYWECFDLLNFDRLQWWLLDISPNVVIHCAAMVNVDQCEIEAGKAYELHMETTKIISSFLKSSGGYMIYISTDSVFDGKKELAYLENDLVNPLNVYAKSKLAGESIVLIDGTGIVLRTNIIGWSRSDNRCSFSEWILRSLIQGEKLKLFYDVYFSPLHVSDLSKIISILINKKLCGLYNISSDFGISKYDFGLLIANVFDLASNNIKKTSIDDMDLAASRPHNMILSNQKISKELGLKFGTPKDSIITLKQQYDSGWLSRIKMRSMQPAYNFWK